MQYNDRRCSDRQPRGLLPNEVNRNHGLPQIAQLSTKDLMIL